MKRQKWIFHHSNIPFLRTSLRISSCLAPDKSFLVLKRIFCCPLWPFWGLNLETIGSCCENFDFALWYSACRDKFCWRPSNAGLWDFSRSSYILSVRSFSDTFMLILRESAFLTLLLFNNILFEFLPFLDWLPSRF